MYPTHLSPLSSTGIAIAFIRTFISALPTTPWRLFITVLILIGIREVRAQEPVPIPLGAHIQQIVNSHPPGTKYILAAGKHRAQSLVPKDGDVISGEPGATLNGCLLLENWQKDGDWWIHQVPVLVPLWPSTGVVCADYMCLQTQDFYLDGERLQAVSTLDRVTNDKTWFLDRVSGTIYLAVDPTNLEAELGGPAGTAIDCAPSGQPQSLGVVIENLTIERYPCRPQVGSIRIGGGGSVNRCHILSSHSYGIQLMRGPALIKDCYIADNGISAIGGTGMEAVVQGCEITKNVWPMYAGEAWDTSGIKVAGSRGMVFRNNYIHHNYGCGLWWDIKTTHMVVEDNIVEFNDWEGILMEISEQAVIRRNVCRWNGVNHRRNLWGAQICMQNASSAVINNNYLETGPDFNSPWGSRQGVIIINQGERSSTEAEEQGDFGAHDIHVHNNIIVSPSGGHHGVDYGTLGWATYEDFLAAGLVWEKNRYLVGQPLEHRWSWRRQPNWNAVVANWLLWEDWIKAQDAGSTIEGFSPIEYPPLGLGQEALILTATGIQYSTLKKELTRRPPPSTVDRDLDGLADEWERENFGSLSSQDSASDPDGDGLTNAMEATTGTDPNNLDTDMDGIPDGAETSFNLNPLAYDSNLDHDNDGRTALEEWQDGTPYLTPDRLNLATDENPLSIWLTPTSYLSTDATGNLEQWFESGMERLRIGWLGTPYIASTSPTGVSMVNPGIALNVPGRATTWGTLSSGSTMSFVFQPTAIDLSRDWRAILTNEVYLKEGFRLRLESGYLVCSAGQSGGTVNLAGFTRLQAGQTYIISLSIEPDGRGATLYLDGRVEAVSSTGTIIPSTGTLMVGNTGGVLQQAALFGDIVIFKQRLTSQERLSVEGFLKEKYFTGFAENADDDRDGLSDEWETANQLDPLTPTALIDQDRDGATNLTEFQLGLNPNKSDTDEDRLPDGWEVKWGTNPLLADGLQDPDQDGLSNFQEFQNGSDPFSSDLDPPFLSFTQRRLWWRADSDLEAGPSGLLRWTNSAAAANHATPQDAGAPILIAPEPWKNHTVVRLSSNALVSTQPVDPTTVLHPGGATITMVVRPPLSAQPADFKQLMAFSGVVIGIETGTFVLRSDNGEVVTRSTTAVPATPFILTWVFAAGAGPATLHLNGTTIAEVNGLAPPTSSIFSLGGVNAWPADVAEVIIHASALLPLHRRFAERVLEGKWLGTGPLSADTDKDTLPDWWEHEACSNAAVADATDDADWDSITNSEAFLANRPGFVWIDGDNDGMHDAWEILHGLDTSINEAEQDIDGDDISNALEHALLTSPRIVETTEPWSISQVTTSEALTILLQLRSSQRSWANRARWESSLSLAPDTWKWLAPGTIVGRGPGATSLEETILSTSSNEGGANRSLVRLKLLEE